MGILAVVAATTGARTLVKGRLGGGIPEIHPNELAGLAALPLIALVVLILRRGVRVSPVIASVVLFGIVVATGSRIALVGILFGAIVALVTNGVRRRGVLYALLVFVPVIYGVIVFTGVVDGLASRGGTSAESTALDSRLTGWQVVLGWDWASWQRWLGVGLSVKEVAVQEKWRSSQVLDSSWVSLLAQAGLLGVLLIGLLVAWCVITAVTAASRRGLLLPLLTMFVIRTFTESGMVDSAMPFVLFVTLSALLTRRSRQASGPPGHENQTRARSVTMPGVR
jgi:O-antigen ligase